MRNILSMTYTGQTKMPDVIVIDDGLDELLYEPVFYTTVSNGHCSVCGEKVRKKWSVCPNCECRISCRTETVERP